MGKLVWTRDAAVYIQSTCRVGDNRVIRDANLKSMLLPCKQLGLTIHWYGSKVYYMCVKVRQHVLFNHRAIFLFNPTKRPFQIICFGNII